MWDVGYGVRKGEGWKVGSYVLGSTEGRQNFIVIPAEQSPFQKFLDFGKEEKTQSNTHCMPTTPFILCIHFFTHDHKVHPTCQVLC